MSDFYIVPTSDVSWQEYRDLRLEALLTEPKAFLYTYDSQKNKPDAEWQHVMQQYQEGNGHWMHFASNGQRLIGMLGGYQSETDKAENTAWLVTFYVEKDSREKGVGTLLIKSLLNEFRNHSITRARLGVNRDQEKAVTFYKNLGFQIFDNHTILFGDGLYHEEFLMEKIIGF